VATIEIGHTGGSRQSSTGFQAVFDRIWQQEAANAGVEETDDAGLLDG